MRQNRVVEGILLLTIFIWGMNTPLMKMGLVYIPPILYNAFRLLLATAFAWPILVYSGTYKPLQRGDGRCILAVSVFGFFLAQLLLLIGLPQTTAGNASIMSALVPLTVVMINRIFKSEVVPFAVTVGIGISLMGVILVVLGSDKEISFQSSHVIGALLILLSQFGSGYYTVFSKDLLERYSPYQIITYIMTISAIAFSVLAIPEMVVFQWQEVPLLAWVSIVFSGLLGLLFGNLVWVWVVGRLGSTRASLYQNLIPIVSILVAWVFLGEVLGWLQCAGVIVIFLGLYAARSQGKKLFPFQIRKRVYYMMKSWH